MRYILYLLTWLALFNVQANAQSADSSFLDHAVTSLKTAADRDRVEKVYLHLDRQNYLPGDTVWFKAYLVEGKSHELSSLSGILNVELISPLDSVVKRLEVKLTAGLGWGDLILPKGKQAGKYRIRAYTNWMRNAGEEYFYDKQINVGDVFSTDQTAKQAETNSDVQFFPEGGELVNGIRSRVAFKVVDKAGLGVDIKGTITDNDGNEVAAFETQHAGMGVFAIIPQAGKSYTAKVTSGSGSSFTVPLPEAVDNGFTLTVNNADKDSLYIKVAASSGLFKAKQNTSFYLVGQSAGEVYYTSKGDLKAPVFMAKIGKSRFPSGITQFTLFSDSGEPMNERIVFIQNNDTLDLKLALPNATFSTRQKVKVALNANNEAKKPVLGSFSVAVVNESRAGADEAAGNSILSYLLLTSDLKGFIEKPNYYFVNQDERKQADLDVLMLTQGYRRFEWKPILNDVQKTTAYKPETTLDLQGVIKTPSGAPVPNAKLTLISSREDLIIDTVADANGSFIFKDLDLSDTAKIVLQARKQHDGKNVSIVVTQPDYPEVVKRQNLTTASNYGNAEELAVMKSNFEAYQRQVRDDSIKNGVALKAVTIKSTKAKKTPDMSTSSNLNGPGHADAVIMGDKVQNCVKLSDCLNGKVFGVSFKDGIPYSNRAQNRFNSGPMAVIVDGNQLQGAALDDINAGDVYSIEVLRSGGYLAIYGSNIPNGALIITMKHGNNDTYATNEKPLGLITYPFKGFYKARQFYSPKYSSSKQTGDIPDLRSTIYWQPDVVTDKNGKASFEFFNADTKGTYRITLEGIDENGQIGRAVYRYKVQ